jgi:serine/alanine adding enzyme
VVTKLRGDLRAIPFRGSDSEWDGYVRALEGSTFCHLAGWRGIMARTLGHEGHYRVAVDGTGEVHGLLPLIRVRSRMFGDYLLSMPFLNYGGPIGSEEAREVLARDAAREAEDWGVDLLELRSREPVPGDLKTSERKLTVLMELPDDPDVLWNEGLKAKVRSQIRRPQKEGMVARFGQDLVGPFYSVFSRTMRNLGTPVLPRSFFDEIVSAFPKEAMVSVVEKEGNAVAAGFGFLWNGEFEMTWAGSLAKFSRMAPNMLLYWAFMEKSIALGAHTFNFGRCSPGSGTHRFKSQWGGRDHPLPWAQWSGNGRDATPAPTGKRYGLARAAWRWLPVAVATRLGPFISRNIP